MVLQKESLVIKLSYSSGGLQILMVVFSEHYDQFARNITCLVLSLCLIVLCSQNPLEVQQNIYMLDLIDLNR